MIVQWSEIAHLRWVLSDVFKTRWIPIDTTEVTTNLSNTTYIIHIYVHTLQTRPIRIRGNANSTRNGPKGNALKTLSSPEIRYIKSSGIKGTMIVNIMLMVLRGIWNMVEGNICISETQRLWAKANKQINNIVTCLTHTRCRHVERTPKWNHHDPELPTQWVLGMSTLRCRLYMNVSPKQQYTAPTSSNLLAWHSQPW